MRRFLIFLVILLPLEGCASKPSGVCIFAAVSTREAVEQIAREFEGQSDTAVTCSFAASSTLARQIEQGAEADLFLSADERWADFLEERRLVAERRDLLANRLVVVTPVGQAAKFELHSVADLTTKEIKRLALALDSVPAGHYAREALGKAGIWEQVKERVREAGDVRATLAIVERDEADAGVVYTTDAATSSRVQTALIVPEDLHTPIRYPLVLLRRNAPAARAFYQFLGGAIAASEFRKAGFPIMPSSSKVSREP